MGRHGETGGRGWARPPTNAPHLPPQQVSHSLLQLLKLLGSLQLLNILPLILLYLCFSFILLSPCFHSLILIHSTLPGAYSRPGTEPAVAKCFAKCGGHSLRAPASHSSLHSKERYTGGARLQLDYSLGSVSQGTRCAENTTLFALLWSAKGKFRNVSFQRKAVWVEI